MLFRSASVSSAALTMVAQGSSLVVSSDSPSANFWIAADELVPVLGVELTTKAARPGSYSKTQAWGLDAGQNWWEVKVGTLDFVANPILLGDWAVISTSAPMWGDVDMGRGKIEILSEDYSEVLATLYVVPEPMTMGLLSLGALFLRRRK